MLQINTNLTARRLCSFGHLVVIYYVHTIAAVDETGIFAPHVWEIATMLSGYTHKS
jgi:hypothetical protein